jgi:hypothetical protein
VSPGLIATDVKIRIRVIPQLPQFGVIATMDQQLGEKRLDDATLRGIKISQPRRDPFLFIGHADPAILVEGLRQPEKFVGNNRHVFLRND